MSAKSLKKSTSTLGHSLDFSQQVFKAAQVVHLLLRRCLAPVEPSAQEDSQSLAVTASHGFQATPVDHKPFDVSAAHALSLLDWEYAAWDDVMWP